MSADQSNLTAFDPEAVPANACVRYEICGNVVPAGGQMCADCLDELRAADRERRDGEKR
jgi:predicted nucleic acid-binding Zn ribbon protein